MSKKTQLIGIRLTEDEKKMIDLLARKGERTLTSFIREAVFSHIYNLIESENKIDLNLIVDNLNKINLSIKEIKELASRVKIELFKERS